MAGAATTVWAATAAYWNGKGGKYLEDCQIAKPVGEIKDPFNRFGHGPHAYDEEKEKQLWVDSLKMVGLSDDD